MNCIRRPLFQMAKLSRGRLQNVRKQTLLHNEGGHTMMSTSYFYDSEHAPLIEKDYTLDSSEKPLLEGLFTPETAAQYLSNLTEEEKKKLQAYKLEYEVTSSISSQAPIEMKDEWWAQLLMTGHSSSKRKNLLRFFQKKESALLLKAKKKGENEKKMELHNAEKKILMGDLLYNPVKKNTIHIKILRQTMVHQTDSKLAQSMLFGRPFVVDMSYEPYMGIKEKNSCVDQLLNGYGANRSRNEPSDLIFTNWIHDSFIFKKLNYIQKERSAYPTLMMKCTEQNYVDLFPKERLVYLSPHSPFELVQDHPDNIYIMGGYVDLGGGKEGQKPVSYAKAKQEKIRSCRLPLDKYCVWGTGIKSLTLNQVMNIMFEFMDTKDWSKAFEHVPRRKLQRDVDLREHLFKKQRKMNRVNRQQFL